MVGNGQKLPPPPTIAMDPNQNVPNMGTGGEPVVPPPVEAPPHLMQPPAPPAKASPTPLLGKIVIGVVVVVAILGGLAQHGMDKEIHSGVFVDGRELTRAEADQSARDMAKMASGARAGDPSSLNTNVSLDSELGQKVQALLKQMQAETVEYKATVSDYTSTKFLSASQLGSDAGRARARQILKVYSDATANYQAQSADYMKQLLNLVTGSAGGTESTAAVFDAQQEKIKKLVDDVVKSIQALLDFVDQKQPVYDEANNHLRFKTEEDASKYHDLFESIISRQREMNKGQADIRAERQEKMSESLRMLQPPGQ